MSKKIKFSMGGAVKPSSWKINIISNIKSQLFREDNTISVGDKVKGSFELRTDIQPELKKVGDVTDDFELLESGEVVLNKRTQIDENWNVTTRETSVDMNGDKEPTPKMVESLDGSDIVIEDGYVPIMEIDSDKSKILMASMEGQTVKNYSNFDTNTPIKLGGTGSTSRNVGSFDVEQGRYYTIQIYCNELNGESHELYLMDSLSSSTFFRFIINKVGINRFRISAERTGTIGRLVRKSNQLTDSTTSKIMIMDDGINYDVGYFTGLSSTQAIISNSSNKYPFYEPTIQGETKVVDGKLVSLQPSIEGLPALGSVPSIADTINLTTKVITLASQESNVLDSNSISVANNISNGETIFVLVAFPDAMNSDVASAMVIERFTTYTPRQLYDMDTEGACMRSMYISGTRGICFRILKSKLSSQDEAGVRAWLQANPVTVRYQLATPIEQQLAPSQSHAYDIHKRIVSLSKVGDVADKLTLNEDGSANLLCNFKTELINNAIAVYDDSKYPDMKDIRCSIQYVGMIDKIPLCDNFKGSTLWYMSNSSIYYNTECIATMNGVRQIKVFISKTKCGETLESVNTYLKNNPFVICYQLATPITTHIPKSLCPTAPVHKTNNLSVGGSVKASSYKMHYLSDTLRPQIRIKTHDGDNKINVTDNIKPSLFKGLFPVRKLVSATFSTGNLVKNIALKVFANNDMGENSETDEVKLYKVYPPKWSYIEADGVVKVGITDTHIPSAIKTLKIKYKIGQGDYQYDTFSRAGSWSVYNLALTGTEVAEVSVCCVEDNGKEHVYSDAIVMSKDNDTTLIPPSNFDATWLSKNELQFSWRDDYTVDSSYELIYSIDGGEEVVVTKNAISTTGTGSVLTHTITLNELETVYARVRMKWHLNNSEWAYKTVLHNLATPTNLQFQIVKEGTNISWDKSPLAEWYIVYVEGRELGATAKTEILVTEEINGEVYVIAGREGFDSDPSESVFIKSKPNHPVNLQVNFNEFNEEYNFDVSFIDNSQIETNYRVEYTVDNGEKNIIEVSGQDVIPPNAVVDEKDPYKLWVLHETNGSDIVAENGAETIFDEEGNIATHRKANATSEDGSYIIITI